MQPPVSSVIQYPNGLPATATITVITVPADGTTITIGGVVYTAGTDFKGETREQIAQGIARLLRADLECVDLGSTNPAKPVAGYAYGRVVRLIATVPGSAGNALTLATSNAAYFTVSGATFSGGTDAGANATPVTDTSVRVSSVAYEASRILLATPGRLHNLVGYNSKASAQFIQVHDSATLPADAAVPEITFTVPAASNFSLDFVGGLPFAAGIVVCNSSTGPTKTIGSADCYFTARVSS